MCGPSGGGGNDAAEYQREQERKRQERIQRGKARLERIFAPLEGYEYEYRGPSTEEQRQQVSSILEGGFEPDARQGFTYAGNTRQRLRDLGFSEDQLDRAISPAETGASPVPLYGGRAGTVYRGGDRSAVRENLLGMFEPQAQHDMSNYEKVDAGAPIWEQQQEAYTDYAMPQVEDQYQDARGDVTYALARQGQLSGSVAGDRWGEMDEKFGQRKQDVASKARGYANEARSDIAQQKQSLMSMLNSTADPGATASSARSAVESLSSQPSFSPVGPLFQNATAGLAAGMQGNRNYRGRQNVNRIVYGSDPDRGSGRVVRGG